MTGYSDAQILISMAQLYILLANILWIFWILISFSKTPGKLNFSNRLQFIALNACPTLEEILIFFFFSASDKYHFHDYNRDGLYFMEHRESKLILVRQPWDLQKF